MKFSLLHLWALLGCLSNTTWVGETFQRLLRRIWQDIHPDALWRSLHVPILPLQTHLLKCYSIRKVRVPCLVSIFCLLDQYLVIYIFSDHWFSFSSLKTMGFFPQESKVLPLKASLLNFPVYPCWSSSAHLASEELLSLRLTGKPQKYINSKIDFIFF